MNIKTLVAVALVAFAGAYAATPATDTSLVLKPTAAQIAAAKPAKNKLCPVSNEDVGSMGGGRTIVYKGQAVKLCCGGCVKKFQKDPTKYMAELAKADEKTGAHDMKDMKGM